ncbi:APH(3') family aminoglycoside O-phosphotransferase [Vallitalea okinawensis]|uniref:APH(3') family aminoglycoside O-phosphotransferase n=1 Tax=Vallitalea okinawensis TaxID=2078660 RepID=UPI000CFB0481|nr:APH(3') family aminoglycoside O-phosphotransferase [Vallitalea okinawensis]
MKDYRFPDKISQYINGMSVIENDIGLSKARLFHLKKGNKELYLKVEKDNLESMQEQIVMQWLQDKLEVPKIISNCNYENYNYLLMTKVNGEMACTEKSLCNPKCLVKALADGIFRLQSVSIADCPFDWSLSNKLDKAWKRIENNEIDMSDWEDDTEFSSPHELYEFLIANRPKEDLVFSHGDYCLPNVFIHNEQMVGLIDVGNSGIADKWQDIALCVRSLEHNLCSREYTDLLFKYLNIEPDLEKIRYYILLDELF